MSSWKQLTDGLSDVVASLEERTYLIVCRHDDDRVYVQFAQNAEALYAEAVADEFLPENLQLGFAGADSMKSLGWVPPDLDPAGMMNWHTNLARPATSAQYRTLVEMSAAALRDVYGVATPLDLAYRAWRDAEPPPIGVTYDSADLEPGIPHLELPELGLTRIPHKS